MKSPTKYLASIGSRGGRKTGPTKARATASKAARMRWTLEERIDVLIRAGDVLAAGYGHGVPQEHADAARAEWMAAKNLNRNQNRKDT
jgi:hypothetical protein